MPDIDNGRLTEPQKPDEALYGKGSARYAKAYKEYQKERRRWLRDIRDKDPMVAKSKALKKEKKEYRNMKDSEWKRKQKEGLKQIDIRWFGREKKEDKKDG